MKRRIPLALAATAVMFVLAAIAASRQQAGLLVLEWAAHSDAPTPPVAEFPLNWQCARLRVASAIEMAPPAPTPPLPPSAPAPPAPPLPPPA